jgi:hypothetical protein
MITAKQKTWGPSISIKDKERELIMKGLKKAPSIDTKPVRDAAKAAGKAGNIAAAEVAKALKKKQLPAAARKMSKIGAKAVRAGLKQRQAVAAALKLARKKK